MSETVKLIIEIDKNIYKARQHWVANPKRVVDEVDIAIANGIPLDDVKAEIKEKAFTEEIFDEDIFRSIYTESMTREEAEEESVIETEIVKLSDVLEILDKHISGEGDKE